MLNRFHPDRTFIACCYIDLRRGIDGLATIVQEQFKLNPFTNTIPHKICKRVYFILMKYASGAYFIHMKSASLHISCGYARMERGKRRE